MKKEGVSMKKRWKSWLALTLSGMMSLSPMAGLGETPEAQARENEESFGPISRAERYAAKDGIGRTQVNFNRNWKFIRSDMEGAAGVDYDDSSWVDVGLPHNFSIPYEMTSQFYVGYGWYRKEFEVPDSWDGKRIELEFEGVFQVAEIYVNGQAVGTHEGGYSGFVYDITEYLHTGENLVAVRVNNIWQHDLAPRSGDHQFTGGIYRDVYLNVTEDVHVAWYGTFVTTPDLTNPDFDESAQNIDFDQYPQESEIMENIREKRSDVRVQTEVVNSSDSGKQVQVLQSVEDETGKVVAEFASDKEVVEPGETVNFDAVSPQIQEIELWSPENPYVYTVTTSVVSDGVLVDTYESPLGFRWVQYKNDAFYLNGEKMLLNGANAHQDHGGFADAVTDEGLRRDVSMIKECGMNLIRGSHYPHDPSYAVACDELGLLFWSECNFWGMGGNAGKDGDPLMNAADWFKDAYPQNPEDEEAFEESCMDSLEAMIRVNRNHPSVINWSMGNEVFFTDSSTQNKAKALVDRMRDRAHQLDPTRKAGMGGCQRENYDSLEICDIAGYNGDGGKFRNDTMPNLVAEYGSKAQDRPGEYRPYYDQIQGSSAESYVLQPNSGGLVLWCAFHHGTIGGDGLAKMGVIDYYRLPLNSWYWYREKYTGKAGEASVQGEAVSMEITATDEVITNDGKKDTQLVVTMKDEEGRWVSDERSVTLEVTGGPGIFPGGKTYTFVPGKSMRDGKASIEFRSFYEGNTVITARAEGLPDASITISTRNVTGTDDGEEPEHFYDASMWGSVTEKIDEPFWYGSNAAANRPVFPGSNAIDGELATDGDPKTSWVAGNTGSGEYFEIDLEFSLYLYKIGLEFARMPYPFKIETAMDRNDGWELAAEYTKETIGNRPEEETLDGTEARYVRITFNDVPEDQKAFLSELTVCGLPSSQSPRYTAESVYLSEAVDYDQVITGWKTPGKNLSCEGGPVRVGGKTYEKGIGVHANSLIPFNADGKYTRISGVAGIDNEVDGGNAVFRIYGDDKLIYERELSAGQSDDFDLSISGVQKLRLETDANGDNSQDHTDWADVRLYGAIRDISRKNTSVKASCVGMHSGLRAGEEFLAVLNLENQGEDAVKAWAGIGLYDAEGELKDFSAQSVNLEREKAKSAELSLKLPSEITGYQARLFVWEEKDLEPVSVCAPVEADPQYLAGEDENDILWTKTDGEDERVEKTGSWTLWESGDAFKGTETCSQDSSGESCLTYTFTGNYVRIGAKIDGSQVGADVYIDGEKAGHMDTRAADQTTNVYSQVFSSEKYESGLHTVKIIPTGKFGLDYIETGSMTETPEISESIEKQKLLEAVKKVLGEIESGRVSSCALEGRQAAALSLTAAIQILSREDAAAEEILKAAMDLEAKFIRMTSGDFTSLKQAIAEAETRNQAEYTEVSWEAFAKALAAAKKTAADEKAFQTEIDQAEAALRAAMKALETGKKEEPLETEKPEQPGAETEKPEEKPDLPKAPRKNSVHKVGRLYYRITKASGRDKTAAVVKPASGRYRSVSIPGSIKLQGYSFRVTAIGNRAFYRNAKLTSVKTGANVVRIGNSAFEGCSRLKKVTVGKQTVSIGKRAFYGDRKLKKISLRTRKLKKTGKHAFRRIHPKAVIDVPDRKVKIYKNRVLKKAGIPAGAKVK